MLKQILYIFNRKEKIQMVLLFITAAIGSVLECVGVGVFIPFVNLLMEENILETNSYLNTVYHMFNFQSKESFLIAMTAVIIFIFVFKNIYMIFQKYAIYTFSYNTQRKISTRLLKAYMSEPYTFFLKNNTAVLQRGIQEDATQFTTGLIHFLELIVEIAACVALGMYLFYVSKSITIIIVGLLAVCVGFFTFISKKYAKNIGKACQGYKAKLYQWMNQAIGGIKEVKVLNREDFFVESYGNYYRKYTKGLRDSRLIAAVPKYIVEMMCISGLLIAVIVKMRYGQKEIIDFIPQLAAFAVAAFRLLPSVGRINEHVTDILYSTASIELVYHDLKEVEELPEQIEDKVTDWKLTDAININNICYKYPDTETDVIHNAKFVIKKGQTVAFIGESGAGKTTMADIILGLLVPQIGKIKADEMNVFENINTWHHEIGYIPQTIYLSDDSIRNNVAFGVRENEIDDERVEDALRKAQLFEFVDSLPKGLDTFVGDRGVRLSGGQRQRIGIARALYHDPEILILDEATSALDNDTEAAVMEAIESLRGEKTMIIIAHRLTTIQNADVVFEVADGKVIEKTKNPCFKE